MAALREVSLAPRGRNSRSWRSTQRKKNKKSSESQAVPVPAPRRWWGQRLEVAVEAAAAAQVCADTDTLSTQPWISCRDMNQARQRQCPGQMWWSQVQRRISSSFAQCLLPLECYHCFYSVSAICPWLCQLCPLLLQTVHQLPSLFIH